MTLQVPHGAAARLSAVLLRLRRALRRRTRAVLGASPLPQAQVELLRALRAEDDLTVGELAARLQLAVNTVSTLAARMAAEGYVERKADQRDRRIVRLRLSAAARRQMQRWRDQRAVELTDALGRLSAEDRSAVLAALDAFERLAADLEARL